MNEFRPLDTAKRIIKDLHVHRLGLGSKPQIISYESKTGIYVIGDLPVKLEAQKRYGPSAKRQAVDEIFAAVVLNAQPISPETLNDPQAEIVIFKKEVLNLRTMKTEPFSPEWFYTLGIPHNFNPSATCPRFDLFMSEILPEEMHLVVKQIMGYLLIPSTKYRKCFVFLGTGSNGKSTLIEIISNCSANSKYTLSGLMVSGT